MKNLLFLLPLLWLSSCAHNTATKEIYTIKHQPTGIIVRIHDGIPPDESKKLVEYLYNDNLLDAHSLSFKHLYNIHIWSLDPRYNERYDYVVNFRSPNPDYDLCNKSDKDCSFIIDEIDLIKDHDSYRVANSQHYMTDPPGYNGHSPSELPPESYARLDHPSHVKYSPLSKLKYEDCLPKEIHDNTCYYNPPPRSWTVEKVIEAIGCL